jgi:hypothetical protein
LVEALRFYGGITNDMSIGHILWNFNINLLWFLQSIDTHLNDSPFT